MDYVISQAVGLIGVALLIFSYQQNTQKKIVLFQIFSGCCFVIQYLTLGIITGAVLNFLGIIRCIAFYNRENRFVNTIFCPIIFAVVSVVLGLLTWSNVWSLLPTVSMVISSFAIWLKNPKYLRLASLPSSPLWFIYNIVNKSYAGALADTSVLISLIIGIIRFDILRKEKVDCKV